MTSVQQLISSCQSRLRKTRNLLTILDSEEFSQAATIFTVEETVSMERHIETLDVDKLRAMVHDTLLKLTPLERLSIKQLRDIASTLCVKNYYNLTKSNLIAEIENANKQLEIQRSEKSRLRICVQSTETSVSIRANHDSD